MILREEQLRALHQAQHEAFHKPLAERLRRVLGDRIASFDEPSLLALISDAHRAAAEYGVVTPEAITKFVALAAVSGLDFHTKPAAQQVLLREDIDGDEKMRLLTSKPQDAGAPQAGTGGASNPAR